MTLSMWSNTLLEDVAEGSGTGVRWIQLNICKDREITKDYIRRAEKVGYKALIVTVDQPVSGLRRLAQYRVPHISIANFSKNGQVFPIQSGRQAFTDLIDHSVSWEAIDWLRSITSLPLLLKGILTREDAVEALKHDIQGIVVSNHGGRHHDGLPATVSSLHASGMIVDCLPPHR